MSCSGVMWPGRNATTAAHPNERLSETRGRVGGPDVGSAQPRTSATRTESSRATERSSDTPIRNITSHLAAFADSDPPPSWWHDHGRDPVPRHAKDYPARIVPIAVAPATPGVEYLAAMVDGEEQRSGSDGRQVVEPESDTGDHPEGAPSTAQRPEQVRVVVEVDDSRPAVRVDDVDAEDVVDGKVS